MATCRAALFVVLAAEVLAGIPVLEFHIDGRPVDNVVHEDLPVDAAVGVDSELVDADAARVLELRGERAEHAAVVHHLALGRERHIVGGLRRHLQLAVAVVILGQNVYIA